MKAAEFPVVLEARRVAKMQLNFFNEMMEAKTAANSKTTIAIKTSPRKNTAKKRAVREAELA